MDFFRTSFRKLTLQSRILVITITILLFWGLFCFFSFRWVILDLLSGQISHHYRTLSEFLAQSAAPMVAERDQVALERLAREAWKRDPYLDRISFLDGEGRAISEVIGGASPSGRQGSTYVESVRGGSSSVGSERRPESKGIHEILFPIHDGNKILGHIKLGVSDVAFQGPTRKIQPVFLAALGGLVLVSCIFALRFSQDITRPVVRLTQLADEISQGNLDVSIDFGEHVNCWEIKHCRKIECTAYQNREVQCWFVDGTPCEGYEPRFPQKLGQCRKCEVYQAHRGDEIVQMADSFKHMAHKLKISQRDLRGAYTLQKCLIQNSFDGIIASDTKGVILIFNRVAEQLTGFDGEEVIGRKTWQNFFYPDLLAEIHKPLRGDGTSVLQGFVPRESVIFHRDGEFIPILIGGVSLTHREQEVGNVVFFYDIREIKRLRRELIQSERMAAVGQTVASISHSVKNILDGLRGGVYIYNHGRRDNDGPKRRLGWEMIEKNIGIISELVIDLLNYSKERKLDFQRYDPNRLIQEVCAVMERKAESRQVQLICEGDDSILEAIFDPFAMHQCLLNLLSNAIDAMPGDRRGKVVVKTYRNREKHLCFRVSDNGTGMSRETKDKILKGMFSTKGSKGTGLGLLVVQKIVKEHQGELEIDSEEKRGSVFLVSLPYLPASRPMVPGRGAGSYDPNPLS